jgi:hypothetical protein
MAPMITDEMMIMTLSTLFMNPMYDSEAPRFLRNIGRRMKNELPRKKNKLASDM